MRQDRRNPYFAGLKRILDFARQTGTKRRSHELAPCPVVPGNGAPAAIAPRDVGKSAPHLRRPRNRSVSTTRAAANEGIRASAAFGGCLYSIEKVGSGRNAARARSPGPLFKTWSLCLGGNSP